MTPAVDPAALERIDRLGGAGFARRLVGTFLDDAPARLAALHDAAARQDDRALAAAAHSFISSAANFGAASLERSARVLERDADAGRRDRYAAGAAALTQAFDAARAELARLAPRPRIAVVEDNPDNRLLVRAMLDERYDLDEYAAGADAVAGISASPPDAVLLDISLPGMDGTQVLARLRADPALASLRVIALTAHAMAGDRERFLALGFDDYLSKPILDERLLRNAVERALGSDR